MGSLHRGMLIQEYMQKADEDKERYLLEKEAAAVSGGPSLSGRMFP